MVGQNETTPMPLDCCAPSYNYQYYYEQVSWINSLKGINAALAFSIVAWIFNIVICWWSTLLWGGCLCCVNGCRSCCNKEKNSCGVERYCFTRNFICCSRYHYTGVFFFQFLVILLRYICISMGLLAIIGLSSNSVINELRHKGSGLAKEEGGFALSIVAIIIDIIGIILIFIPLYKRQCSGKPKFSAIQ